MKKSKKDKFLY